MRVVAFVPDLMDRSRVASAVPGVELAADLDGLVGAVEGADVVLVDLGRPGVVDHLPALVGAGGRVVGFASHVDTALLAAGEAAGAEVLPRSRFFRRVAELVGAGGAGSS